MKENKVVMAVFTGTGNTLVAANALAERFMQAGKTVEIVPMDRPELLEKAGFDNGSALGLAVPVACLTTYPTVWRFIDALPEGNGRSAFFLATMGGLGLGMQGPIGRALARKGYRLIGARLIQMGGNYGADTPSGDALDSVRDKGKTEAEKYGDQLLNRSSRWGKGWLNPVAPIFAWLGRRKTSLKLFYRIFPLAIDKAVCTGCTLCEKICPERNIAMRDGKAELGGNCQSCQRCIGFCPAGAIRVPGKTMKPYHAVSTETLTAFLRMGK